MITRKGTNLRKMQDGDAMRNGCLSITKTKGCVAMTNHLKCITRRRTLPQPAAGLDPFVESIYIAALIASVVNIFFTSLLINTDQAKGGKST
jgi:hypothetical protein